ncbi:hypothetical protein C8R44DRAFT_745067 [Mycena epipterygia]|nr:hypothetical protein C8R44DRAFT_745067 [Mycena epipterygia]
MSFRKDRVRAIGVFKARAELTPDQLQARALKMVEAVNALPIMQQNLLKYEVSFKVESSSGTLAGALGLRETELSAMVLVEAESHEKIRETRTDAGYRRLLASSLENITSREDFHFFPAEFVTVIDK